MLGDELLALPERLRTDHDLGTQQNLTRSIAMIDGVGGVNGTGCALETLRLGPLMRDAGYVQVGEDRIRNYGGELPWFGSLPDVERRIAKRNKERDDAQARLDAALRDDAARERPADGRAAQAPADAEQGD